MMMCVGVLLACNFLVKDSCFGALVFYQLRN